jgi:peptidoglycan/LPS O-acetylase OafA/YrhL
MLKRYFKNLDGLRFVAATTVALSHLETLKEYRNLPLIDNRFFDNAADISVTFFFVLSGFLIMWWFLEESGGDTTKIAIRPFYGNRIFRTWPLYYLVVFVSIFISIRNGVIVSDPLAIKRYIAYLFFLPNIADVFFQRDIYLGPTWSLAVEEFFYLLFPLLLKRIEKQDLLKVLILSTAFFIIVSMLFNRIFLGLFYPRMYLYEIIGHLSTFFERYRFYSFLSGAIAAVMLFNGFKLNNVRGIRIYMIIGLMLGVLFFNGITFSFMTNQVYSLIFAAFVFFMGGSNDGTVLLNNNVMRWGGKISYGIYMLHMFIIMRLINQGSHWIQINNEGMSILLSWLLCMALTLLVSYVSYSVFENPVRMAARKWFLSKTAKNES